MLIFKWLVTGVAFMAAAIAMAVGSGAGVAFASSTDQFCSSPELREYYPPLKGMQSVPQPPGSGRLPFGPGGLKIQTTSQLLTEAGLIGFYVDGYLEHPHRLNWDVVTQLVRVDRKGRAGRVLRKRRESVGVARDLTASPLDLSFKIGNSPALYRVDSYFRSWTGKLLAHYADYFRLMKRTVDVRLGIYKNSLHPGEALITRMENLGTASITFGKEFELEIWDGTTWVLSPVTPQGFPQLGLIMGGGGAAECDRMQLPIDVVAGRYRVSKPYSVTGSGRHGDQIVRVEFDVSA